MDAARKISRYYARMLRSGRVDPDFFEFVRRMEFFAGRGPVGESSSFRDEPVRFAQMPHLHFPQTAIAEISERERLIIFVFFLGLTGCGGPLPLELTNYAFQRAHNYGDFTIRRFHDIIHHRFIGLFYRAWKSGEQAVSLEENDGGLITAIVRSLSGYACEYSGLPRFTDALWSGLFGCAVKSRSGLEALLRGFLRLPVHVRDMTLSRGVIPVPCRCRLGHPENSRLGRTVQLGSHFWSRTRKFVVEIGTASFAGIRRLLPGSAGFCMLTELVGCYLDRPLEYDLRFILDNRSLPAPVLGGGRQLGRGLWLGHSRTDGYSVLTVNASRLADKAHHGSYK